MFKYLITAFLISTLIFLGCGKSKNKATNSETKQVKVENKFEFTEKFGINIDSNPEETFVYKDLTVDDEHNIYLLDGRKSKICKFNSKGEFVKTFGNKGNGPGEFIRSGQIFFMGEKISVFDSQTKKIIKFDKEGKFISNINTSCPISIDYVRKINDELLSLVFKRIVNINEQKIVKYWLEIRDVDYKLKKSILIHEHIFDYKKMDPLDFIYSYTVDDSLIYIALNGKENYEIKMFDFEGNYKSTIKKDYRKIQFEKKEIERYSDMLNNIKRYGGNCRKSKYKKAINGLFIDKYNNLLVLPSKLRRADEENSMFIDFYKDNKYITSTKIDTLLKGSDFMYVNYRIIFKNDLLYIFSLEDSELRVFEYEFNI